MTSPSTRPTNPHQHPHSTQSETAQLSAIVHVDTAPPECLARIQRRARQGEDVIALDYLRRLDHFQVPARPGTTAC